MDDSSGNFGGTEECSSNESGWTKYITSPTHENNPVDDDEDDDNDNNTERNEYKEIHDDYGGDGESDDSMASDASSGPSHQGGPCGTTRGSYGRSKFEHAGARVKRSSSGKKGYKHVEKKPSTDKTKAPKEEQGHKGKSGTGNVHSKGKSKKK